MPVAQESRPLSLPQCLDALDHQYSMMVLNVQKENTSLQELIAALSKEYLLLLSDTNIEERVISMARGVMDMAQSMIKDLREWFHNQQHAVDEMKNGILRSAKVPTVASSIKFNSYDRSPQAQKILKRRVAALVKQNQKLKKENWDLCGLLSEVSPRGYDPTATKASDNGKDVNGDRTGFGGSQNIGVANTAASHVDPRERNSDDSDADVSVPRTRQMLDDSPLFSARVVRAAKDTTEASRRAVDVLRFTRTRQEDKGGNGAQQSVASCRGRKGENSTTRSPASGATASARRSPSNGKPSKRSPHEEQPSHAILSARTERAVIVRPKKCAEPPKPRRSNEGLSRSSIGAAPTEGKTHGENTPTSARTPRRSAQLTPSRGERENVAAGPRRERKSPQLWHADTQAVETPLRKNGPAAGPLGVSRTYSEDDAAISRASTGFVNEYASVNASRTVPFQRPATDYLQTTTPAGLNAATPTAPPNEVVSLSARTDAVEQAHVDTDHDAARRGESRPGDANAAYYGASDVSAGVDDQRKFDNLMALTRMHVLRSQTVDQAFSGPLPPFTQSPPNTMRELKKVFANNVGEHSAMGIEAPPTTMDTITPMSSLRTLVTASAGHTDVCQLPTTATTQGQVCMGSRAGNKDVEETKGGAAGTWRPMGDRGGGAWRKDGLQRKTGGGARKMMDIALDNVTDNIIGGQRADGTSFDQYKVPTQMTRTLFSTLIKKFSVD